jgi:hypothetical protein
MASSSFFQFFSSLLVFVAQVKVWLNRRLLSYEMDKAGEKLKLAGGSSSSVVMSHAQDIVECGEVLSVLQDSSANFFASPNHRKRRLIEFTYRPRKVKFENENYESGEENDELNPLKVSAIVCGVPVLTEREADYRLSQKVEGWKKFLFLLSNVPYIFLALSSLYLTKVEHRSFHPSLDPLCESSFAHCLLACLVSITSIVLHTSQVRVGHWCCSPATTRTFHRRRTQDKFDLADCTCASLAVILTVMCHGITEMGMKMVAVVPIFLVSIIAKKLKWWNLYLLIHGAWHLSTAYLLWEIFVPVSSPLRF